MCKKEPYNRVQSSNNAPLKKSQLIICILGLSPWSLPKAGFILILDAQIMTQCHQYIQECSRYHCYLWLTLTHLRK